MLGAGMRRPPILPVFLSVFVLIGWGVAGTTTPQNPEAIPQNVFSPAAQESAVYKTVDGRELKLFFEKPPGWKASDKRPAMVWFHGGGWVGGGPEKLLPQSAYFASRGMVGVRVQYRLIPNGDKGPPVVCCQDAKSAMRWVRAHAAELGVDPERIGAGGGSAGGHLAAFVSMVAGQDDPGDDRTVSPVAHALVLFNPVADNGPQGGFGHERIGDRVAEFSPAHNIRAGAPPVLILSGREDKLVPVATVERFQAAMKQAGVRCDVVLYDKQGHGFFNSEPYLSRTLAEADRFLASMGWLEGPPTRKEPEVPAMDPLPQ